MPASWQPGLPARLSKTALAKSLALLQQAFPTLSLHPAFAWTMLNDLSDRALSEAVLRLIQTHVQVYPGTNWIALIRSVSQGDRERRKEAILHAT